MKQGAASKDWIGVDRHGLAALLERRGVGWAIYELVQNALDTEATEVVVTLEEIPRSPRVRVTVEDNDPTGFALDTDTPIPTPNGWSTMGALAVGDLIYDERGLIRHVAAKTDVMYDRPCYAVTFDNGEVITTDANHLWTVTSANDRAKGRPPRTLTTRQMADASHRPQHYSTGLQPLLEAPDVGLPIDPYLLGYWLGDGTRRTGAVAVTPRDAVHLRARAECAGYTFTHDGKRSASVHGLRAALQVLKVADKDGIPSSYLRAPVGDRMELLRGLADSDGSSSSSTSYRSTFYNSNPKILAGFEELVWSLGGAATCRRSSRAGTVYRGIAGGRPIVQRKDGYRITFTVPFVPFALPRKAEGCRTASDTQRRRIIRSIKPCLSVPVVCIATDAPSGLFLCGRSMVATHNCDLRHAFTMFAPSEKASDAERRGRFNLGCKLVLARCIEATVTSTTGTVHFDEEGRHDRPRTKRPRGSSFTGIMGLTRAELHEIHACLLRVMPPARTRVIATWINAEGVERQDTLTAPEPLTMFPANLVTEVAQAGGGAALRRLPRDTTVHVHAAVGGPGWLYEMGIPVVVIDGPYHLDVQQKIPLGFDRDGVAPGWLAKLRALALNHLAMRPETDVTAPWVAEAVQQPQVDPVAVNAYLTGKYGPKFVIDDPRNRESVREAQAEGYAVIYGGAEAATTWGVIRDHKLAEPASRMFPPPGVGSSTVIPSDQLSESYRVATRYAMALSLRVLHLGIAVQVIDGPTLTCLATWRRGATPLLTLNRSKLGAKWFADGPTAAVNDLLIHEMAHQFGEHLTSKFDDAMSRIGADMVHLALTEPAFFMGWFQAAEGAATL